MKIVHVEDYFLPSAGYQLNFLAKWNAIHGNEVTIITSNSLFPWVKNGFIRNVNLPELDRKYKKETGVNIVRINSIGTIFYRQIIKRKIFKIIEDIKPDVVMVHGVETLTGIRFALRLKKFPFQIIFDDHMIEIASNNRFKAIFRYFMKKIIMPRIIKNHIPIVAVSKATQNYLIKHYNLPREILPIIPLGTDTSIFSPSEKNRFEIRKQLKINNDDFVFIYTGKISSDKKVKLLALAFKEKFIYDKRVFLIVIGSGTGSYYEEVANIFSQSANQVILLPTQNVLDLAKYYQASDCAVWPGASSLSFYDAQACGLPVILEDIDINRERLSFNNGFIFKTNSVSDLRQKMLECLQMDNNKLHLIGLNGLKKIEQNFSYDFIAKKFEEIMSIQLLKKVKKCI